MYSNTFGLVTFQVISTKTKFSTKQKADADLFYYSTVPNNHAGKIYIFSFEKHGGRCLLETVQLFYFSETSWLVNYEGLLNYFFVCDLCKTIVPNVVSFLL